jgi:hypothetical protein
MSAAVRPDGLAFLLNGESRQEEWHSAVLAERRPMFVMAGDPENELPISALVEEAGPRKGASLEARKGRTDAS